MNNLLGHKQITVALESGETAEVQVRQIPIRDYDTGFKFFTDEIALVGFLAGKNRDFALTLTPDSYEAVLAIGAEVNAKGFFGFCRRRIEANSQAEVAAMATMAQLPEDVRKLVLEQGAKVMASQTSSGPSSPPQPRRV